jgi:hypothetical protein
MDAARQVVRWSIPGWIFLFWLGLLKGITYVCWGYSLAELVQQPSVRALSGGAAAIIVASGVPLGFLLYQVYYSYYGRYGIGRFVTGDRGHKVLGSLPPVALSKLASINIRYDDTSGLVEHHRYRLPLELLRLKDKTTGAAYRSRAARNWSSVRTLLDVACVSLDNDELKKEYTSISDIFHSLGAARVSVFLAALFHILYVGATWSRWPGTVVQTLFALLAVLISSGVTVAILSANRWRTQEVADATLGGGLAWLVQEKGKQIGI